MYKHPYSRDTNIDLMCWTYNWGIETIIYYVNFIVAQHPQYANVQGWKTL